MKTLLTSFLRFFRTQASGGAPLLLAAALALLLANGPFREAYERLWETPVGVAIDQSRPLRFWINDGLMAIFFLVVGLEIKREFIGGELSGFRKAALPMLAALGGMLCPALLYIGVVGLLNQADPANPMKMRGWGIPTVTDIAFALGALALLGNRVPAGLKIFLSALAIIDDLGAIALIAVLYSHHLAALWILPVLGMLMLLWWLNRRGIKTLPVYLMAGILLWTAILNSGLHPTLAGVLLAFTIPAHAGENPDTASHEIPHSPLQESPLQRLADGLQPWVSYGILPLFAFCNAGVSFPTPRSGATWWENPISWGVVLGLLLGKPLGISLFSWLAVRLRLAELPQDVNLSAICATGFLGGIGFTMSLFIALLAFQKPTDMVAAKIAVLSASLLSGFIGLWTLRNLLPQRPD